MRTTRTLGIASLAITAILTFASAQGGVLFVSPTGSDGNDGTVGSPLLTINRAFERAEPADTIYLRGGVYNQLVETSRDGAPGAPITIMNYAGEIAYIDGTGVNDGRNGFIIDNSYITVIGLKVRRWPDSGIWAQANVGFLIIRGCEVYECGNCISLFQGNHDFIIDSVDLHHFAEESAGFDATSHDGTPIYNGIISNSTSHDGGGGNCDGFGLGHATGYDSFDDVHDIRFVNCEVYNIGDGFDISGRDITLERCIAHDTYYGGNYKLWATNPTLINCIGYNAGANVELDVGESPPVTARLYNCTFVNGVTNNIWIQTDSCRLYMFNCILAGGETVGLRTEELFERGVYTGDYNVFHCGNEGRMFADPLIDLSMTDFQNGKWTRMSGQDSNSIVVFDASRLFVDTNSATINLRLRAGSRAINSGREFPGMTPTIDIDGNPRNDGRIDIGAFEYQGPGGVDGDETHETEQGALRIAPIPLIERGRIRISLAEAGRLRINLYSVGGKQVSRLLDQDLPSGEYDGEIRVRGIPPGTYTIVAALEGRIIGARMIAVR